MAPRRNWVATVRAWRDTPAQIEANAAFESEYAEGEAEWYRQENVWWRKVLNFILKK